MISFLIILASFIAVILFDFLPVKRFIKNLFTYQKESFVILTDKTLSEKEKQKSLLLSALKILIESGKIFLFFFILISPYIGLIYAGPSYSNGTNFYDVLTSFKGFFISSIVFLLYYLLKKQYGKFGL